MLEQILPKSVAVVRTKADLSVQLFPEEELLIRRAVDRRRREFTTTRACARVALAQLGIRVQPIPVGTHGSPRWPAGTVGSITHCDGYRAAAVARTRDFSTIGIDAEPHEPIADGVLRVIALGSEREWLQTCLRDVPEVCWDRLLFSIKEAVFKAWFTLTSRTLGFGDSEVELHRSRQEFSARLSVTERTLDGSEPPILAGRWLIKDGLIGTAVTLSTV